MAIREKLRLGDVLVKSGMIDSEQLNEAVTDQKKNGWPLGKALVKKQYISEEQLVRTLSDQLEIPAVDLRNTPIRAEAIQTVKENLARKHKLIPVTLNNGTITVAMSDPLNLFAVDEVTIQTGLDVERMIAGESDIERAIQEHYGVASSIQAVLTSLGITPETVEEKKPVAPSSGKGTDMNDAPVARLVEMIIKQAIDDGASDIHIEPGENLLQIRFRIDGVLFEGTRSPKSIESALISRIKVMANMDISEARAPQDGGFSMRLDNRDIEFRVSTCPTIWGENVVLRILDRSKLFLELPDLGLTGDSLERFQNLLKNPYGVLLVTGPTGSGKTTTLYAALSKLNRPDKNIKTIEDPVEYRLPGIRQTQVNAKANITFATGLRSLMRQDPDIIMVGEIRDEETSEIAIQAALTGHLVLSTLHTNDAAGALTRLSNMGVEPFLLESSIVGILAQRLVRRICNQCKVEYEPSESEITEMTATGLEIDRLSLFKGEGCKACKQSGYSGRIGIFELLVMNDTIRRQVLDRATPMEIRDAAIATQNLQTLRKDGMSKVLQGWTTLEEVNRVTFAEN
ncbi:MAG: type II secretion system protein GspE [Nitrospinaceae bacterium]|nr:type II secretion system protein GspE [Nitrospinaceae bacterium]NIR57148.1 type II secretion system protein GspE [Nitrospinaceae bacterium]NIS87590.1 type II secretion system protein GspE [Nitrospinaceae bacterium]NIT84459.1 type II secretion system protein GspE [Nitrospinaceae bacterium]NIU46647.1 type II secretion system protein GspE [Nitrospinaceae bacterium]